MCRVLFYMYMSTPSTFHWPTWIASHLLTSRGGLNNRAMTPDWWQTRGYAPLYDQLHHETAWCAQATLPERLYLCWTGLGVVPACEVCGTPTAFRSFVHGYRTTCSRACAKKSPSRGKKIRETTIAKYGADRRTIVEKAKQTNRRMYGVEYTTQSTQMQQKSRATKRERYGTDTYNNPEQAVRTNLARYGVPYTTQAPIVKEKIRDAHLRRYEGRWVTNTHIATDAFAKLKDLEYLRQQNASGVGLQQLADALGVTYRAVYLRFVAAGIPIQTPPATWASSKGQQAIATFLRDLGVEVQESDRTHIAPKELDMWLPEYRVAVEYNGTYYHSYDRLETPEERRRHATKRDLCRTQGIRLIQFWDTEWRDHPDVCQSILRSAVGRPLVRDGARRMSVCEISSTDAAHFLVRHHLQGSVPASLAVGLRDIDGILRAVMTFGRPRFSSHYTWELLRFAVHTHWQISGAASKLWQYAKRNFTPGDVVGSYCDRRLFTGNVYAAMGMTHASTSPPGYVYLKHDVLLSRVQFQKHKLATALDHYDPALTEAQNMFANGYRRLWDCGHDLWIASV